MNNSCDKACTECKKKKTCAYKQDECPHCHGKHIKPFKFNVYPIDFPLSSAQAANLKIMIWACFDCGKVWKKIIECL